jgi:hypothetical protein
MGPAADAWNEAAANPTALLDQIDSLKAGVVEREAWMRQTQNELEALRSHQQWAADEYQKIGQPGRPGVPIAVALCGVVKDLQAEVERLTNEASIDVDCVEFGTCERCKSYGLLHCVEFVMCEQQSYAARKDI